MMREQALTLDEMGISEFHGHTPTLFPHKLKPEEHLTSRLIAVLVAVRPFRMRFFEHTLALGGRRPSRARDRASQVRALGLLEPRLEPASRSRADAIIAIRNGSRKPWRCALEVKYLSQGRRGPGARRRLNADQLKRTYQSARNAGLDHVLTISHETAANGVNPSGFSPPSNAGGPTMSHLSWLGIAALLQRTIDEDAEQLDRSATAILVDLAGYLRESEIWNYANNVLLARTAFATVRNACRSGNRSDSESAATRGAFAEVVLGWQQFATAAADGMTAQTGVLLQAQTLPSGRMINHLQRTGLLEFELVAAKPELGSIAACVDLRGRTLQTSWTVNIASHSPSDRPRTATRWTIVETILENAPRGIRLVEVLDTDGELIAHNSRVSGLRSAINRNSELLHRPPESVRFVRRTTLTGREDFKSNTVTPEINEMMRRTVPW